MDINGIVGEMGAGKADLALASLSSDPDRLEKMDFSDTYYEGKLVEEGSPEQIFDAPQNSRLQDFLMECCPAWLLFFIPPALLPRCGCIP